MRISLRLVRDIIFTILITYIFFKIWKQTFELHYANSFFLRLIPNQGQVDIYNKKLQFDKYEKKQHGENHVDFHKEFVHQINEKKTKHQKKEEVKNKNKLPLNIHLGVPELFTLPPTTTTYERNHEEKYMDYNDAGSVDGTNGDNTKQVKKKHHGIIPHTSIEHEDNNQNAKSNLQVKINFKEFGQEAFNRYTLLNDDIIETQKMRKNELEEVEPFNKYFNLGLVVDWWTDVCLNDNPATLSWNPLFPVKPTFTTYSKQSSDEGRYMGKLLRRVHGYIYTEKSGFYDFSFLSKGRGSLIIINTRTTIFSYKGEVSIENGTEVAYIEIDKQRMKEQDKMFNGLYPYYDEAKKVWMKAYRLYFVEIIQVHDMYIHFQLLWRRSGRGVYKRIPNDCLLYEKNLKRGKSAIVEFHPQPIRESVSKEEQIRNDFCRIPVLKSYNLIKNSPYLTKPQIRRPVKVEKLYDGFHAYMDWSVGYPKELFTFSKTYFTTFTPDERLVLEKNEALDVASKTFNILNELHAEALEFDRIVHVRRITNKTEKIIHLAEPILTIEKTWYLVEIDVRQDGKLFRASHYMKPTHDGGLAFIPDYQWNDDVLVNIITAIKDQYIWFKFMIKMLQEILEKTNEKNVRIILVDCGSTDADYKSMLSDSKIPHKYLRLEQDRFNKVQALNYGLKNIEDSNSIGFILDLHLQLPTIIFDRIRKLTIQDRTAFTPTLIQLGCGEHELYTNMDTSIWLDTGTGMLAMYMSDWVNIEAFNEKMFANKWGGEDWEILDRVIAKGYKIFHFRMARFYHLFHSRKGGWYEKSVKTVKKIMTTTTSSEIME